MNDDGDVEYAASYRNDHGNGYDIVVSNPQNDLVDILLYQVVSHQIPEEPSVSLALPYEACIAMMRAMAFGADVVLKERRTKAYN